MPTPCSADDAPVAGEHPEHRLDELREREDDDHGDQLVPDEGADADEPPTASA